ncbi:MAG: gamma-butyrobetaine hydroxylase-like domain-containing protein [Hyphomonadaceae bacterium]|jgi:DUF971 family protein|nr:gamma-butyrobetaine hydroxylase-like domain-containing protein [Hyphomonadaceae bacterium]
MASEAVGTPWPLELVFQRSARVLDVTFDDGARFAIPFELLRVESPSAEVQGHSAAQKITLTGKERVGVLRTEPVGRYAVRIIFDDGHNSGLYTWPWIYRLGLMTREHAAAG